MLKYTILYTRILKVQLKHVSSMFSVLFGCNSAINNSMDPRADYFIQGGMIGRPESHGIVIDLLTSYQRQGSYYSAGALEFIPSTGKPIPCWPTTPFPAILHHICFPGVLCVSHPKLARPMPAWLQAVGVGRVVWLLPGRAGMGWH